MNSKKEKKLARIERKGRARKDRNRKKAERRHAVYKGIRELLKDRKSPTELIDKLVDKRGCQF